MIGGTSVLIRRSWHLSRPAPTQARSGRAGGVDRGQYRGASRRGRRSAGTRRARHAASRHRSSVPIQSEADREITRDLARVTSSERFRHGARAWTTQRPVRWPGPSPSGADRQPTTPSPIRAHQPGMRIGPITFFEPGRYDPSASHILPVRSALLGHRHAQRSRTVKAGWQAPHENRCDARHTNVRCLLPITSGLGNRA